MSFYYFTFPSLENTIQKKMRGETGSLHPTFGFSGRFGMKKDKKIIYKWYRCTNSGQPDGGVCDFGQFKFVQNRLSPTRSYVKK